MAKFELKNDQKEFKLDQREIRTKSENSLEAKRAGDTYALTSNQSI